MFNQPAPLAQAAAIPSAPTAIFTNPATQLGAISPFASLAAFNPSAALAAKSPTLQVFNPAVNPQAAFLQWNPAAAPTLALTGGFVPPIGYGKGFAKPFAKPFGKFSKFGKAI